MKPIFEIISTSAVSYEERSSLVPDAAQLFDSHSSVDVGEPPPGNK